MAELADAADSKSADLRVLGVRLPLPAPFQEQVKSITDSLHGLGYHLWMSGGEHDSFVPFSEQSPLVEARFFLIATTTAS